MSKYYRVKTLMLKGQKGDTGYGISNVQMNDDYTLTITLENGMHFNTSSIRGEKGERGACIRSVELRDDYSLLFTLDNGETLETTAILGKEFENIRTLEASATSASKIATSASTSASASAQSASEASISASESASNASTSASASAQSATNASESASASAQSATNASQSATSAQESASSASTSADTATSKATEASASATKAKESETNAKQSETNASNSAKEAKASADSVATVTSDVEKLKEDLPNKITKFYASNQGETHITDSDNGKIQDMMVYGKSIQDGTPTIEKPIDIKSVVNPTIKFFGANILKLNELEESTFTKNGITFSSKGGVIKVKGTALIDDIISTDSTGINRLLDPLTLESGKTYIYNPNPTKGEESFNCYLDFTNSNNLGFSYSNSNVNNPTKVTDTQAKYPFVLNLVFKKGTVIDMEWQPQLLLNEKLLPYAPYTEQTFTLPYTLNAVSVPSDGNITIDNKKYVADYIDVERGKLVKCVKVIHPKESGDLSTWTGIKEDVTNCRAYAKGATKNREIVLSNMLSYNGTIWGNNEIGATVIEENRIDFTLPYAILGIDKSATYDQRNTAITAFLKNNDLMFMYILREPQEIDLTAEQVKALKALKTYYPTTNIKNTSEQLEGYTVFNYPISMANGWNYVKKQLNDNRDYIYDMDLQSAEAYVNSEYAVTLTELEV